MRCWRRAPQRSHSSRAIHAHRTVHTAGSTGSPFGTRCCSSAPESQRPWLCTSLAGRLARPPRKRLARPGRREPIAQPTAGASCASQHGCAPPSPHHNLAAPAANAFGAIRYETRCAPPRKSANTARGIGTGIAESHCALTLNWAPLYSCAAGGALVGWR